MNPLFTNTTTYTFETYKQFAKFVSNKINKFNNRIIVIELCFLALAAISAKTGSAFMKQVFIVSCFFFPPAILAVQNKQIKKTWNTNKIFHDAIYTYEFYEDRIEAESPNGHTAVKYENVYKVLEDKNCFFIMIANNQGFMIDKSACSPDLCLFIQNIGKR